MRLAQVTAGVLVAVAALTGCSAKEPANDTLPTPSATAAEATPTLPPLGPPDMPMPAEARRQAPAGMEAFVRYYVELINHTSEDMDSQYLRAFSDECGTCDRIATETEQDAHAGYSYQGGSITIRSVAPATVTPPVGELSFLADQAALSAIDASGDPVAGLQFNAIPNLSSGARARWDANQMSWLMTELTLG
jgi:hypothetical protein